MVARQALAATADGMVTLPEAGLQDLRILVITAGAEHRSEFEEIPQELEAMLGGEGLRMELNAPDRELAMA
jgi:hypothetical protein